MLDSQTISSPGFVTKWLFHPKAAQPFKAMVFRPSASDIFTIVGIDEIDAGTVNTANMVPSSGSIWVEPGDVVGFAWDEDVNPEIAWDDSGAIKASVRWLEDTDDYDSYSVGMSIETADQEDAEVSFEAEITNFAGSSKY